MPINRFDVQPNLDDLEVLKQDRQDANYLLDFLDFLGRWAAIIIPLVLLAAAWIGFQIFHVPYTF